MLEDGAGGNNSGEEDHESEELEEERHRQAAGSKEKNCKKTAMDKEGRYHKLNVNWEDVNMGGVRQQEEFVSTAGVSKLPVHMRDGVETIHLQYFELFFTLEMQNLVELEKQQL